jgi:hypothetical protein
VIQARGVSCAVARRIARAYLVDCRDELLYEMDCTIAAGGRSWVCGMRLLGPTGDYSLITCRGGAGHVTRFHVRFEYT